MYHVVLCNGIKKVELKLGVVARVTENFVGNVLQNVLLFYWLARTLTAKNQFKAIKQELCNFLRKKTSLLIFVPHSNTNRFSGLK